MTHPILRRLPAAWVSHTSSLQPVTTALLPRSTSLLGSRQSRLTPTVTTIRASSHGPYSPLAAESSASQPTRKKVTLPTLAAMHARGERITMLTAHDFPSAHAAALAGMDTILVGDSLAMVALGYPDTAAVTVEDMLLHCRSVARGSQAAANGASFVIGDLPMGSYEVSAQQALQTAIRFVKEGRVHAVKLEGGADFAPQIRACVAAGIPVLAHVGLTPQRQHALGGFRVQGRSAAGAREVWRDACAVQAAGAFGVVLEAVPAEVAAAITRRLRIPTIGIGAGPGCSGQVLVQIDMAGYYPPGRKVPKFVKRFGNLWAEATRAVEAYRDEVKAGTFPATEHTYPIAKEELAEFERMLEAEEGEVGSSKS